MPHSDNPLVQGNVIYPSVAARETHAWFRVTTAIMGGVGGALGAGVASHLAGDHPGARGLIMLGGGLGALAGVWLGNRTPPR